MNNHEISCLLFLNLGRRQEHGFQQLHFSERHDLATEAFYITLDVSEDHVLYKRLELEILGPLGQNVGDDLANRLLLGTSRHVFRECGASDAERVTIFSLEIDDDLHPVRATADQASYEIACHLMANEHCFAQVSVDLDDFEAQFNAGIIEILSKIIE